MIWGIWNGGGGWREVRFLSPFSFSFPSLVHPPQADGKDVSLR